MQIDWELLLKVWAVLGPLIAGAASAIWSRKIQIDDRRFQDSLEERNRNNALVERELAKTQAMHAESYAELKAALANFMVSTNDFVSRQCEWLTNPNPESKSASLAAMEKFNYHCQLVTLLAKAETADLATNVWNSAFDAARSYNKPLDDEHRQKLEKYRREKLQFIVAARAELLARSEA